LKIKSKAVLIPSLTPLFIRADATSDLSAYLHFYFLIFAATASHHDAAKKCGS